MITLTNNTITTAGSANGIMVGGTSSVPAIGIGTSNLPSSNITSPNITLGGSNPTISTGKGVLNVNELIDLTNILKERLLIITPNFEKHEKYSALKKAYDNYKLIEAMLSGENND